MEDTQYNNRRSRSRKRRRKRKSCVFFKTFITVFAIFSLFLIGSRVLTPWFSEELTTEQMDGVGDNFSSIPETVQPDTSIVPQMAEIDLENLYSPYAILVDLDSGTVLKEKNSTDRIYPASLTKIMTAILAIENTEDLEEIGAEGLLAFYRELLETARVKVFFCGEKDEALLSLRQNFKGKAAAEDEAAPILKEKPHFLREETDAAQARLLLGFLGDVGNSTRETALLLLNQLLGGDPDSFLFRKLREEDGLCYEIKSYRYPLSPYFFVQAGIRAEDAKRVCAELLSCLEEWKKNGICKEKLAHAKESLIREYTALADSPWGMVDFLAEQALQGKELTTERLLRQIERTEAADVVRAAKHFRLQTVYLLQGKERTQDAD